MATQHWTKDLLPEPRAAGNSKKREQRGNPAWAQAATIAIMLYLVGWVLSVMPSPQLRAVGTTVAPYLTQIAIGVGLAATVLFVVWLPAKLRSRTRGDSDEAEQVAIADELKIPVERVEVRVKTVIWWRSPFWRLRKAVVWLPRGKVTTDPSKRLSARLEPLLGSVHKKSWQPRRGRLVLIPGAAPADDEVDIPEAHEEPRKRAVQVVEGILKTDQLRVDEPKFNDTGEVTEFKLRHPTNVKVAGSDAERVISERLGVMLPDAPGGRGWKVTVNPQQDYLYVLSRTPLPERLPHPLLDYAKEFEGRRFIPFGQAENDQWMGWDIDTSTQCPHCLLVGPTGTGKTSTIRSIVVGATRQSGQGANQIEVWGLDPKMIELMGLDGWPGVSRLAFTVGEMAALISTAYDEMMDRYRRIKAHQVHPSQLPALIVILDEFFILRAQLIRWWKEDMEQRGMPPHLTMLNEMLALARSAGIYICVGIQRPDASHFDDGARDNMRTRVAHAALSPEGRRMMWGSEGLGVMHSSGVRGRVMASGIDGNPLETQQIWTPDLDRHPLARQYMSQSDIELVEVLRPADYSPWTITKDGLHVPRTDTRDIPEGSSQREMMDETAEVYPARELEQGDRIKWEKGGRWETASVEFNSYEVGDSTLDLEIIWDNGGGGETLGDLDPAEEVYCVERAKAPAGA